MKWIGQHILWLLGLVQIVLAVFAGATDIFSPQALKIIVLIGGAVTAIVGYIKANPPDVLPPPTVKANWIATVLAAVIAFTLMGLFGCANSPLKPLPIPIIPPAQLAAQICPIIKADLLLLEGPAGATFLSPAQQAKVTNTIVPANNAVCAAGATVDLTDLQAFNNTIFPALIEIVSAVPAIPNQPAVLLGLTLAQPILNVIVQQAITASQAAPASPTPTVTVTK